MNNIDHMFASMIVKGYRHPLMFDDMWDLMPRDKSETVITKFEKQWQKQVKKTGWQ